MIERCGDRQRKFDGLQRWPFHFIIESLPVMLQIALLLLACGLCRYILTINTPVAWTLIILTGAGVLFYAMVVIAGTSSYDCPFQTPGSALLRSLWKKVGPHLTPVLLVIIVLRTIRGTVWRHISVVQLALVKAHHHSLTLLERVQLRILSIGFYFPQIGLNIHRHFRNPPLPTIQEGPRSQDPIPWFAPNELATILEKNSDNAQCASWVLKYITDPEAVDTAIRLAGDIWWFKEKIDVKPLYDLITFTFDTCFGSDGMLHQGLRNRAYYSGRAILWIHTLAVCESEEFSRTFPFPTGRQYRSPPSDPDLQQLCYALGGANTPHILRIRMLLEFGETLTHPHVQWSSSVLLHLSCVAQFRLGFRNMFTGYNFQEVNDSTPLDVSFNLLLMCCNFLDSPIGDEVLKIQDKSYGISFPCSPIYSCPCLLAIA